MRVEAGLQARTIADALQAPTFRRAARELGRPAVTALAGQAITEAMALWPESQRMGTPAVVFLADALVEEYPTENLADVAVFLRRALMGRYGNGETFGQLSVAKVMAWWKEYLNDKAGEREQRISAQQGVHRAISRDLAPSVVRCIQPVIESVRKAQNEEADQRMKERRSQNLERQMPLMTDDELRSHYRLVSAPDERAIIMDEAKRRGLITEKKEGK